LASRHTPRLLEVRALGAWLLAVFFGGIVWGIPAAAEDAEVPELVLKVAAEAGEAYGEALVKPDCAGSALTIAPSLVVAQSWLDYLNSRVPAFEAGYAAAGYTEPVTSARLGCRLGIGADRMTRSGNRRSRHAYYEACDGNRVSVNGAVFDYRRAVRQPDSPDRAFFVAFLDNWGVLAPGCDPRTPSTFMGWDLNCTPIIDNCGVIDWRERGANSQYGQSYHLSYCYLTDPERSYE